MRRIHVELSDPDYRALSAIAEATGRSVSDLVRRAVPLIKVSYEVQRNGKFLGVASDASKLERELML